MRKFFERISHSLNCNYRVVILAIFWLLGIALGYMFATFVAQNAQFIFRSYIENQTSVLRLWVVHFFPFICAVFAHRFSLFYIFYLLNFVKAVSYSFCNFCVIFAFGSAGWLVRILFLFTDAFSSLLLFYFSLGCLCNRSIRKTEYLIIFFSVAVVCIIDGLTVSPFLSSLFSR